MGKIPMGREYQLLVKAGTPGPGEMVQTIPVELPTPPKPEKRKPARREVSAGRLGDDKYTLTILVVDEHEKGVADHPLIVKDGDVVVTPPPRTDGRNRRAPSR